VTFRDVNLGSASNLWLSAIIVAADQATKAIVRTTLPLHGSVNVVPGFADLTQVRNTGAAFGLLNAVEFPFKPAVMMLAAVAALVGIAWYAASLPADQRITRVGLALILGGAVGNLIDRVTMGYVVDFVDVYWGNYHFWAFNVADSAITVGVGLMLLEVLGAGRHAPKTL
jgi:signal peptidase II